MRLSEFIIPTESVELAPGQSVTVRGLNFNDLYLTGLTETPALAQLYQRVRGMMDANQEFTVASVKEILMTASKEFPELVAKLVACAADEPGDAAANVFKKLPALAQLTLIEKIVTLTAVSEAELKKLQEMVIRLVGMAAVMVTTVTTAAHTPSGSGVLEQK